MKLKFINRVITEFYEADGTTYRLTNGHWEVLMGESWESCQHKEKELENSAENSARII